MTTAQHEFYPTTINGGGKVACGAWLAAEGRMCKRPELDPIHPTWPAHGHVWTITDDCLLCGVAKTLDPAPCTETG